MGSFRTIVGGRSDRRDSEPASPRALELLLKKAKADPDFRRTFLSNPLEAAASIGLEVSDTEAAMLEAMPRENLAAVVDGIKLAPSHLRVLRSARTAAALAVALSLTVAIPSFAGTGVEVNFEMLEGWDELGPERLAAVQKALEEYRADHGEYPSTAIWMYEPSPLEELVPGSYLYDPWYDRFRYEAILEDGLYVGYRLEARAEGDAPLQCPDDPQLHAFDADNPIVVSSPYPYQSYYVEPSSETGQAQVTVAAQHADEAAELFWYLDREFVQSTIGDHTLALSVGAGIHELNIRDAAGNTAATVFEVRVPREQ